MRYSCQVNNEYQERDFLDLNYNHEDQASDSKCVCLD
jgi:hypothetical protein